MRKVTKTTIEVKGSPVTVLSQKEEDYISLTDIARYKNAEHTDDLVRNWLRNRNTIEFLGVWERLNNPGFNPVEFDGIRIKAGLNSFTPDPEAMDRENGRRGHRFQSRPLRRHLCPQGHRLRVCLLDIGRVQLYLIKEFQRLKEDENRRLSLAWNLNRTLSKLNYRIHTDAIKAHLIPAVVTPSQAAITYATEADLLNVALFGQTAKQWRGSSPKLDGNMRDYATIEQLLVLANIEGMNAEFIHMGLAQGERLKRLNEIAIRQMRVLTVAPAVKQLKG